MNIHLVEGNLTDYASLKSAMNVTEEITGGSLDYVIANAALQSSWSAYSSLGVLYVCLLYKEEKIKTDDINE